MDAKQLTVMKAGLEAEGAIADVIARLPGTIKGSDGSAIPVAKPAANAASIMYDAVFLPAGEHNPAAAEFGLNIRCVAEAYAHGKPIAAASDAIDLLKNARIPIVKDSDKPHHCRLRPRDRRRYCSASDRERHSSPSGSYRTCHTAVATQA